MFHRKRNIRDLYPHLNWVSKIFLVLFFFSIVISGGCKKGNTIKPVQHTDTTKEHTDTTKATVTNIYVAGTSYTTQNISVATYWKNGVAYKPQDTSLYSEAYAIAVLGNDVYMAGLVFDPKASTTRAAFWKNGVVTMLADAYSIANSISIIGNEIYFGGFTILRDSKYTLVYWKNGVMTNVTDGDIDISGGKMIVMGNDVYMAGTFDPPSNGDIAAYWKNGVMDTLTRRDGYSEANAIAVDNSDVYVGGTTSANTKKTATYWKNGIATQLAPPDYNSFVEGMLVNSGNVYAVGQLSADVNSPYVTSVATCWKNGVLTKLTDGSNNTSAAAIAIDGNDIYVVGNSVSTSGAHEGVYWKNGKITILSSNSIVATSIVIVKH